MMELTKAEDKSTVKAERSLECGLRSKYESEISNVWKVLSKLKHQECFAVDFAEGCGI